MSGAVASSHPVRLLDTGTEKMVQMNGAGGATASSRANLGFLRQDIYDVV